VRGSEVGRIETAASFRPPLIGTGVAVLFSGLLGFAMFFALRVLPLRVLDRTLGALRAQTLRFETALDNMSRGLCMFDAGKRLVVSNKRFSDLLGIPPENIALGMTEAELLGLSEGKSFGAETGAGGADAGPSESGVLRRANGNIVSVLRQSMANGGEVVTYEDITERRRAEAKISHMVRHDALTDLPNRLMLDEELEQALNRAAPGENVAVLCLDIDNFKSVNDTLGHAVGDDLLRAFTRRLRDAARDTDTVARLGGDEFAIAQTSVAQPLHATALAVRLVEAMGVPFDIDGHQVVVGTSIGIALAPGDGTDPRQLLKSADMALYRAKADGGGSHRFFEAEMDARMRLRRALETDLRKATAMGQFELFYQPIVDIGTEEIIGFEALLRWNRPECGMVQPNDFIPLAEETGLIVPIGEWVIQDACKQAAGWPGHVKVAVNLSPVQFKSRNLVRAVKAALATSGLAPWRLELEITESVLLQDNEKTLGVLHQLHDIGIRISMDDFGTGYSSLSYLRKFPFDKIKIDRSFINEMSDRDDSLAIVRAVSAIGVSLGMLTTAEGVETREQFERVKNEGCTQVQGYLFGAPQPATEVTRLLAETTRTARVAGKPKLLALGS
jgi:diguanylate cyclase (GGDEF)-like protein